MPASPSVDEKMLFNLEAVGPREAGGSRAGVVDLAVVAFDGGGFGGGVGSGVAAGNKLRVVWVACRRGRIVRWRKRSKR